MGDGSAARVRLVLLAFLSVGLTAAACGSQKTEGGGGAGPDVAGGDAGAGGATDQGPRGDAGALPSGAGEAGCSSIATCPPQVCEPGSQHCADDQSALWTCSDDGATESSEPCGAAKTCVSDQCQAVVCPPNTKSCEGKDLLGCNSAGTTETKLATCGTTEMCDATVGACVPAACLAGSPLCEGDLLTVCKGDGSGPAAGGSPCPDGQACHLGACNPVVCAGAYQCLSNGHLMKCGANGTSAELAKACASAALCDPVAAKCIAPTCALGSSICSGSTAIACKADQTGYETSGSDCALDNEVCVAGGCVPKVCTPNTVSCVAGNPALCNSLGTSATQTDTCVLAEYCSTTSTVCLADKCNASAPVCNGNLATTCAADGSVALPGGTDCTLTGEKCDAGECKPVVCTPSGAVCLADDLSKVFACNASGTAYAAVATCANGYSCSGTGFNTACKPTPPPLCSPGGLGCNLEVISTCGSDGNSWTAPSTNCASNGQVCVLAGSCADREVTTQGGADNITPPTGGAVTLLSDFRVLTPRRLTAVGFYTTQATNFSFVVYRRNAANPQAYDLVASTFGGVTPCNGPTCAPVWNEGAFNYLLEAGQTYAVGIHLQVFGASVFSSSSPHLATAGFLTAARGLSLVQAGPVASSIAPNETSASINLRFTTRLP